MQQENADGWEMESNALFRSRFAHPHSITTEPAIGVPLVSIRESGNETSLTCFLGV